MKSPPASYDTDRRIKEERKKRTAALCEEDKPMKKKIRVYHKALTDGGLVAGVGFLDTRIGFC